MCFVKTLLGKPSGKKFQWRKKTTHIFWYALCIASLKILSVKPIGTEPRSGKKGRNAYHTPWLKHHLISCDDVSNLRTLWLVYSFLKKNHTFLAYGVSFISTKRTFDLLHGGLLFLHKQHLFASLIARILLCLHMQTHSVLDRALCGSDKYSAFA